MDLDDITDALYKYRDSYDWEDWVYRRGAHMVPELGVIRVVDTNFSDPDEGDEIHIVFEHLADFDGSNRFYKIDGTYSSFGRSRWSDCVHEVKQAMQWTTVYKRVDY
jgi:hypothetical protein